MTIGALTRAVGAGKQTYTVKLTAKARRALKRARRVTFIVTARMVDSAANVTIHSTTLKLKR